MTQPSQRFLVAVHGDCPDFRGQGREGDCPNFRGQGRENGTVPLRPRGLHARAIPWLLCAALAGCSDRGSVSGKVTLNGKPLETGTVSFHPAVPGPLAYGTIDAGGGYELRTGSQPGVAPGEYVVTVSAIELVPPEPGSRDDPLPKPLTPERYGSPKDSPLRYTVARGSNRFDIELTGEPQPASEKTP